MCNRTIPSVMTYKSWWPHNISAGITNNFCRAWARRKWEMLALIIHSVVNTFPQQGEEEGGKASGKLLVSVLGPVILIRPRRKSLFLRLLRKRNTRSIRGKPSEGGSKPWEKKARKREREKERGRERERSMEAESCVTSIILRNSNNANTRLPMSGVILGLAVIIIGMAGLSRFPNGHPSTTRSKRGGKWKSSNYRLLRIRSGAGRFRLSLHRHSGWRIDDNRRDSTWRSRYALITGLYVARTS